MKKNISLILATLVLVLMLAPAVLAASDDSQDEIEAIYQQMFELRKQLVLKWVELGTITPEQAEAILERHESMYQYHLENGFAPQMGAGFGRGCGAFGFGRGFGAGLRFAQ